MPTQPQPQKIGAFPNFPEIILKYRVNRKVNIQANEAVNAHPMAFKCDGKISDVITQIKGPNPENSKFD